MGGNTQTPRLAWRNSAGIVMLAASASGCRRPRATAALAAASAFPASTAARVLNTSRSRSPPPGNCDAQMQQCVSRRRRGQVQCTVLVSWAGSSGRRKVGIVAAVTVVAVLWLRLRRVVWLRQRGSEEGQRRVKGGTKKSKSNKL